MSAKPTGGPAFPGIDVEVTGISSDGEERFETRAQGGMTLRDYFAAKAMAAWIGQWNGQGNPREACKTFAKAAYEQADAMLEARDKS